MASSKRGKSSLNQMVLTLRVLDNFVPYWLIVPWLMKRVLKTLIIKNFASYTFNARRLKKGLEEKLVKKRFESVGVKLEIESRDPRFYHLNVLFL